MKITAYYENKQQKTILDVPDEECEIWVEKDYQRRLEAATDAEKPTIERRSPQRIMDEEINKPTFYSNKRETRRHVSLNALDADDNSISGSVSITTFFPEASYPDLYHAIRKLTPQQQLLLHKVFWEGLKQVDVAREEGVKEYVVSKRMDRIIKNLKKSLESEKNF